jgi:3-isopropylmalate/(R)-2-methylmalate dehydratase small subunit
VSRGGELERVQRRTGRGVVVRGDDIDTDQIIPARFLRAVTFEGLGEHAFEDVRFTPDKTPKGHPFDDPRFAGAGILLVNRNFGCGSSREHAPQALVRRGIRALVGESFAEIFFGNCVALGIPAVCASHADQLRLMDAVELDPGQELTVDLERLLVSAPRLGRLPVQMPEGARRELLDGTWDATRVLLLARSEIEDTARRLPYLRGFRVDG